MPLDSNLNTNLRELAEISSKYLDWYLRVIRNLVYPKKAAKITPPKSFTLWLNEVRQSDEIDSKTLSELEKNHDVLVTEVEKHLSKLSKTKALPDYDDFNMLMVLFEGFLDKLRRLEKDVLFQEGGLDELTGLKSDKIMHKDLAREMDRLDRQGKPFSVAILRINNFDQIIKKLGPRKAEEYIQLVAGLIQKSIRSFDDAYYIGNAEFILSLKQADISGGIRALERLEELLLQSKREGKVKNLNASCYVAEPTPHQDIDELLRNLRSDLENHISDNSGSAVSEYHDISPLQRYVKSL